MRLRGFQNKKWELGVTLMFFQLSPCILLFWKVQQMKDKTHSYKILICLVFHNFFYLFLTIFTEIWSWPIILNCMSMDVGLNYWQISIKVFHNFYPNNFFCISHFASYYLSNIILRIRQKLDLQKILQIAKLLRDLFSVNFISL